MCVCVCVWLVVIMCRRKRLILIMVRYETAVAWAIWCSGQFFISLACMDASKMLLSQHVCSGIPCKLQEIWSQRSISAWSVECVTLIIPSLSWHCSEAAGEPGQWAHCQIHLVLIPYHLMSQNIFLETFYFIFFSPIPEVQWVLWLYLGWIRKVFHVVTVETFMNTHKVLSHV